jgi:methionine aminotransferase
MAEFRKVHQFNVFTVNTPMQYGLASYLNFPNAYTELPTFYQQKRDFFRAGLMHTNFSLLPAPGTYFQCVDYSQLKIPEATLNEVDFCQWLTTEVKVAAIPVSAFYRSATNSNVIRFCYAKKDATLIAALEQLRKIAS